MTSRKQSLDFTKAHYIGRVFHVDTSRISIVVEHSDMLRKTPVGSLVAVQGSIGQQYLIGIVNRVTRQIVDRENTFDEDEEQEEQGLPTQDTASATLVGTFKGIDGETKNHFRRGADCYPQIDQQCFLIEGDNLQRFMGSLSSDLSETERLKLGTFTQDRNAQAIANGDRLFQRHAAILGSTGSGKSWTVALILERAAQLKYPNLVVFDLHGEYSPLANPSNAKEESIATRLKIAGPGDFGGDKDDGSDVLFLPHWLLSHDEIMAVMADRSESNAPNQAARLSLHIRNLKEQTLQSMSESERPSTFTVDSPIPYRIEDLQALLRSDDIEMVPGGGSRPVKGPFNGKLTRFLSRLDSKVEDRRYSFMFQAPDEALEYRWLSSLGNKLMGTTPDLSHGIKILDFSEVPSDFLPIVTGTVARLLYSIQFWMEPDDRRPLTLLCDEAHLYLPRKENASAVEKQALGCFESIAKEGRKYGFSLVVVSQRPADISKTILSQCNNFIVSRLSNDVDQSVIRSIVPASMSELTDVLPILDTGEALCLGDAMLLPSRIRLDKPTIKPLSATLDFWTEWNKNAARKDVINLAVESFRAQTRRSPGANE